jgi:xanthine/uracil permease
VHLVVEVVVVGEVIELICRNLVSTYGEVLVLGFSLLLWDGQILLHHLQVLLTPVAMGPQMNRIGTTVKTAAERMRHMCNRQMMVMMKKMIQKEKKKKKKKMKKKVEKVNKKESHVQPRRGREQRQVVDERYSAAYRREARRRIFPTPF